MQFATQLTTQFRTGLSAAATGAMLLACIGTAAAAPVDLSSWQQDGSGNWTLQTGNNAVFQSLNSRPTMFHNGVNSQGKSLSGTIEVQTAGDDDFIGFVLGYQQGELFSSSADYLLIDWKQTDQSGQSAGLAISHVTGPIDASGTATGSDAWQHSGPVNELQRGATLGTTGWDDNTEYTFDLIFTPTLVQVFVDGGLELSVTGTFSDGAFGFYNYSQPSVLYAGIQEDVVVTNAPAAAAIFALAALGLIARRRKA